MKSTEMAGIALAMMASMGPQYYGSAAGRSTRNVIMPELKHGKSRDDFPSRQAYRAYLRALDKLGEAR